jgi:hypothetical protein
LTRSCRDSLGTDSLELGNYLLLVDYTGRFFREGMGAISRELAAIFERIGTTAETWQPRLEKLSNGPLLGRLFAASRQRLREVAEHLGLRACRAWAAARRHNAGPKH